MLRSGVARASDAQGLQFTLAAPVPRREAWALLGVAGVHDDHFYLEATRCHDRVVALRARRRAAHHAEQRRQDAGGRCGHVVRRAPPSNLHALPASS